MSIEYGPHRDRYLEIFDRPISFHRIFIEWTGSVNAALMLSQLVFWSKRSKDFDGWIYKTAKEWEEEIGLTVDEQYSARKRLRKKGLVEEHLRGVPAILHFRLTDKFYSLGKSPKLAWGKAPNYRDTTYHSLYKDDNTRAERSGGCFLSNGEPTPITNMVDRFAQFMVKHRLHSGRKGSTINGWQKETLFTWAKFLRNLAMQEDLKQIQRIFNWYLNHFFEDYIPKCYTLKSFCERFGEIIVAHRNYVKKHPHEDPEDSNTAPQRMKLNGRYVDLDED